MPRPLFVIANDIAINWPNTSPHAAPYLRAMASLSSISDFYGCDSARSIVAYFLSNAQSFRGEAARRLKAELRTLLSEPSK